MRFAAGSAPNVGERKESPAVGDVSAMTINDQERRSDVGRWTVECLGIDLSFSRCIELE